MRVRLPSRVPNIMQYERHGLWVCLEWTPACHAGYQRGSNPLQIANFVNGMLEKKKALLNNKDYYEIIQAFFKRKDRQRCRDSIAVYFEVYPFWVEVGTEMSYHQKQKSSFTNRLKVHLLFFEEHILCAIEWTQTNMQNMMP